MTWQVIHGDCLEVLKTIPDGSVDAVVTDPPYGLDFPYLSYDDTRENLERLIALCLPEVRRVARRVYVLCGPTQINLYPQADWVANVTWNTCPKPITVMRAVTDRLTMEEWSVLDPFCGSGTTGVACVQTGRKFIGIEIDEGYCQIARRRIAEAVPLCATG